MVPLEASKLFSQANPGELTALRRMAREQAFTPGREIFKEGDAGNGLYVVKEGMVEISVLVGEKTRHVFSQVGPGDFFGEMAVIEDKPRSASAVAKVGTEVYFLPREEMLKLVDTSPGLTLALLREISSRLREFNRQYLREVLQAERLAVVGRFARAIVHDLKNPLNIIGLTAEVAGMDDATPEMRQGAVRSIRQQVERISQMVSEILDFTQGATPNLVLPPVDYAAFVQHMIEELGPETGLRGVTLELDGPLPEATVLLNPKRLHSVFANLINNATDAMPDGGKVRLRVRLTPNEAITEVEDTGPGIAPEIADQLFEPFATFGKAHGTGLGLSICKRIIEDHGGRICVRSEPGHGAIFSFSLPLPRT